MVLDQQEQSNNIESLQFTAEIRIEATGKEATIFVPPELRITPALLNYIGAALDYKGLTLKHMNISKEHEKEIAEIPNVVLQKTEKKE